MTGKIPGTRVLVHAVLIVAVFATLSPIIWMLGTSLKPQDAVFSQPLNPLPLPPTLGNYLNVVVSMPILRQLLNSFVFAGGVTFGQVLVAAPAAYFFARHDSRASRWLFAAFLLTLPVPFMVFYVPNYLLISRLGLLDTYAGMILPQIANAYGIFLLRQHFKAFPVSVLDAARIDGASEWTILWRIVVPASRAAVAALAVFVFVNTWNEYVWPLLVARDPQMQILTVGVAQFFGGEGGTRWASAMAAATVACAPTLLVYVFLRKQIVSVFLEGAVK